jgi:hypothetical protein
LGNWPGIRVGALFQDDEILVHRRDGVAEQERQAVVPADVRDRRPPRAVAES